MRAERATLAALVLGVLALPLRASDIALERSKIVAHAATPWPDHLNKGYYPIVVTLQNNGERARRVDLLARGYAWNLRREVSTSIELEPGKSARVELLAPLMQNAYSDNIYQVAITAEGGERGWLNDVGAGSIDARFQAVLALVPSAPPAGTTERWTASISTQMVGGSGVTTTARPTNDDIQVRAATFDEMSASYVAYTSLDLVAIDTHAGLPEPERLEPLLGWVRLGGTLALFGPNARDLAQRTPALAAWLEPRFELGGETAPSACGLGHLVFETTEAEFLDGTAQREIVRRWAQSSSSPVPDPSGSRLARTWPSIPGLGQIPHRVFAGLLIAFAILIGPVNFIAVRRRNKPALLLITIPAIALVTSLVLLGYGVFFQGLDVKTASLTCAVLDQRAHRSACIEQRQMFAGSSPAAGLRPGPGSSVYPSFDPSRMTGDSKSFFIENDGGALLSGEYLPTRVAVEQVLLYEQAARERVSFSRQGDALVAENALGVSIEQLVVRDAAGRFYGAERAIAAGERAQLAPLSDEDGARRAQAALGDSIKAAITNRSIALPNACYGARLQSAPFRDDCGIHTRELVSDHCVLGVLALDDEVWR